MTSHRDRIESINRRGNSLPRNYYRSSQNGISNTLKSEPSKNVRRSKTERKDSYDENEYQVPVSPIYQNNELDQVKFQFDETDNVNKNQNGKHLTYSEPNIHGNKTNNSSRAYLPMQPQRPLIYKSQSLKALKSKEPTKSLAKSTIQQEYHDKLVQQHITNVSQGPAKRPCMIATIMFVMFGILFIVGLLLICLTYIYKNINFSLDKGEMIGPIIMAGSFIFLGVGAKFIYDAHRIVRRHKKTITYRGYDRRYVGLKNGTTGPQIQNEKLISGTKTDIGLARMPNKKVAPIEGHHHTIGVSTLKIYGHVNEK